MNEFIVELRTLLRRYKAVLDADYDGDVWVTLPGTEPVLLGEDDLNGELPHRFVVRSVRPKFNNGLQETDREEIAWIVQRYKTLIGTIGNVRGYGRELWFDTPWIDGYGNPHDYINVHSQPVHIEWERLQE